MDATQKMIDGRFKKSAKDLENAHQALMLEQEALRKAERQHGRGSDEWNKQLAAVNAAKAEAGRASNEHVETARARALALGGTNHAPPVPEPAAL